MNVALLRLSRRFPNGVRHWQVPGQPNAARLVPSSLTGSWCHGAAFHWPAIDPSGDPCVRGLDLARHLKLARAEARKLLNDCIERAKAEHAE